MAEYATIAFGFDVKKEVSSVPLSEFNKQMTIALGDLTNKIEAATKTFQGGGWTILSHSSAAFDNRLLVTVLLQR